MGRWVCDIFSHFVVRTFYVAKYFLKGLHVPTYFLPNVMQYVTTLSYM